MRVVVVLNEEPLGSHPDVHEAFGQLRSLGVLDACEIYAYLHRLAEGVTQDVVRSEIRDLVEHSRAELVVWMHTHSLSLTDCDVRRLRASIGKPLMVYWEGDSYHPRWKPLPQAMLALMKQCDVVYLPCGGPIISLLARSGVREVRYAPSCASGTRFPHVWRADAAFDYDVVMVGNRVHRRLPLHTMPGARRRARLAKRLARRYGRRFAVVGRGWSGPSALGPCGIDAQRELYARSVVTIGVNNSTYPLVFSNRLPIALASGIPVAYNRNPGFEHVFGNGLDDVFFTDDDDAVRRLDWLLTRSSDELTAASERNRTFFSTNLARSIVAHSIVARMRSGSAPTRRYDAEPSSTRHRIGSGANGSDARWTWLRPLVAEGLRTWDGRSSLNRGSASA